MRFMLHLSAALAAIREFYSVPQPAPVTWKAYDAVNSLLQVQWPNTAGTFQLTYVKGGVQSVTAETTATEESVPCGNTDGSEVVVSYVATVGADTSPSSPPVTFMCAGLPHDTLSLSLSQVLNQVTVSWPPADQSSVGTPVLFYVFYKYDSAWTSVAQLPPTTLSYVDNVTYGVTYQYKVSVVNWVGESLSPPVVSITPVQQADPTQSTIARPVTVQTMHSYDVVVTLKDASGAVVASPPELLFYIIEDYCIVPTGQYECIRVDVTNVDYIPDFIGPQGVFIQMTNNKDGTYSASYTPRLRGPYIMSVVMYRPGGLWGEVWDNIWLNGVPDKKMVVDDLSQSWGELDLIATYAGDFVSYKMSGLLLSPVSETVTLYVTGNDGIRLYWGGVVVTDLWDTCCSDQGYAVSLVQGAYYPIKVEWKQLQGTASFAVTWESFSLPKQTIPKQYLFYPKYVQDSPWRVDVSAGLSSAPLCFATNVDTAVSGVLKTIHIYSVDARGDRVDNPTDAFSLVFTLPTGGTQLSFSSVYLASGDSVSNVRLTTAGTYSVAITLYGIAIKNSPYSIVVTPGSENAATTYSSLLSFVAGSSPITCGITYAISFARMDAFRNAVTTGDVDLIITFVNEGAYVSPIGVSYPIDWVAIYGHDYQGSVSASSGLLEFHVYHAGSYTARARLNGITLGEGTANLSAQPNVIFPPRCLAVLASTTVVAGSGYVFHIQLRDEYFNISLKTMSALASAVISATSGNVSVPGSIQDEAAGVLKITLPLVTTGQYTVSIVLNSISIQNSGFTVSVTIADLSAAQTTLSALPASVQAGVAVTATVTSRDAYLNVRAGLSDSFVVTVTGKTTAISVPVTITAGGDGTYAVTFTPVTVDVYTVLCTASGNAVNGSGQSFSVTPGLVAAAKTTVAMDASYIAGKGSLKINSFDAYSNAIATPVNNPLMNNGVYKAFLSGPQSYTVIASYSSFTNYEFSLSLVTKSGTYSLLVGLEQEGGLLGFYYEAKDFTGLIATYSYHNTASGSPQSYTTVDPVISFNWKQGQPASIALTDYFSIKWVGKVKAINTEVLTLIVTADDLVRLTWAGSVLLDTITTGAMVLEQRVTVAVVKDTLYSILLEYVELTGGAKVALEWQSDFIDRAVIPSTSLFSLLMAETSPMSITFTSDVTDTSTYLVENDSGERYAPNQAGAGILKKLLLHTYDRYGNQQSHSETVTANFASSAVVATVTETSPGLHSISFTLTTVGANQLLIFVVINTIPQRIAIFDVAIDPGPGSAVKSDIMGLAPVGAGTLSSFVLVSRDASGNARSKGGETVSVIIYNVLDKTAKIASNNISVIDNNDGSYTIQFKIQQKASYRAEITLNDMKTVDFDVIAGTAAPGQSQITLDPGPSIELGTYLNVYVTVKDTYGNAVTTPQTLYGYLIYEGNPNFLPLQFAFPESDVSSGFYQATVKYDMVAADMSGTCKTNTMVYPCIFTGNLLLYVWLIYPGLEGMYFPTTDFTGSPRIISYDNSISVNWASNPLPDLSGDSLSIQWIGLIKSSGSRGIYGFTLTAVDTAVLTINQSVVIDTSTGASTGSISLAANTYYQILIRFVSKSAAPSMTFMWSPPGATAALAIPTSQLYHRDYTLVQTNPIKIDGFQP